MKDDIKLTFIEHLEELRGRIIKSAIFFLLTAIIFFNCIGSLMPYLLRPVGQLVAIAPTETFLVYVHIALLGGFFLSSPYTFYHIWSFVSGALLPSERKYTALYGGLSIVFFILGACFAFSIVLPIGLKFLLGFSIEAVKPMISIKNYVSFVGMMMLSFGVVFELPVIVMFLTSIGIIKPDHLKRHRKIAILIIFVLAAILTPPDVVTQILLSVPLLVLYEMSVMMSIWVYRKDKDERK